MANLLYQNEGTNITWRSSGGTNAITLTSLGAGAGRQGAHHDFGVAARAYMFTWRLFMQFATAPAVDERVRIYGKAGDATHYDNDDGTGDIAVSAEDKLKNLKPLGVLTVDEASATPEFSASGLVYWPYRIFAPVIWNGSAGDAFSSTAADHGFDLTPVPPELQ